MKSIFWRYLIVMVALLLVSFLISGTVFMWRTYTMTVESLNENQTLFYMDLWFKASGATVYGPASFETVSDGEITRYPGSNNQFVWNIPRGHRTVTMTFKAPDSANVTLETLYVKAFNGSLYENGVAIP